MKLRAPAKVNLSLRILGRRPDGYHEIESLMTPISLADEITIETSLGHRIRVACDDPSLPTDWTNLAAVAAGKFYDHTGLRFDTRITIRKRIPHGAGLGGGSSDAASVLVGLDALFETHLGAEALEALAAKCGSDVPFFIRRQPAWVRGRGERVEPASLGRTLVLVLVKPAFAVETPWAYRHWAGSSELPGISYEPACVDGITLVNDLERPVFEKFLLLPIIKRWLGAQPGVLSSGMSGSGSTMFAVCDAAASAQEIQSRAREHFGQALWSCVCETHD
jgi:4-diphosphocytidyl-2-C-methyl-D-erythritol kinase